MSIEIYFSLTPKSYKYLNYSSLIFFTYIPFSNIFRWNIFFNSFCRSSYSFFFAYDCWTFSTLCRYVFWYFYKPLIAAGVTPKLDKVIGSNFDFAFAFFNASSLLVIWLVPLSLLSGWSYLFFIPEPGQADYFNFDFFDSYFLCYSYSNFFASDSYFLIIYEGSPNNETIFLKPSACSFPTCYTWIKL